MTSDESLDDASLPFSERKLGSYLRECRRKAGFQTAADATRNLQIDMDTLWEVEEGRLIPDVDLLSILASRYSLTEEEVKEVGRLLAHDINAGRRTKPDSLIARLERGELHDLVYGRRTPDGGIFISYRRSDQPWYARSLCTKLRSRFGEQRVFIDIDDIEPGADFAAVINEKLGECAVLIVVIGNDWLNAVDVAGNRRIDDISDLVRLEIELALARHILVIPILVDGASIPRTADLPESLRPLARLNAQEMSHARFGQDCLKLINTLQRVLGNQSA